MTPIDETINMLTPEAKREVADFVESVARKYLEKEESGSMHSKNSILKFAGAWKDMDDKDYEEFIDDVYRRRQTSFV